MPLPERSLPGGALLLVALIVAACAYAIWYYRAAGERARTERVAEVPSQLIPLPAPAAMPASEPNPAAEAGTAASAPATGGTATGSAASSSSDQVAAVPPAGVAPPGVTAPSAAPVGVSPAAPTTTEPPAAPAVRAGSPLAAAMPPALPPPAAPAEPVRLPAIPEPPATAPALDAPRVYGVTNGPVRIIIKAAADSWVQIRDADQAVISMRVLKQGEIYRVPDRPGLILRTGNAGGLEITVDGRAVPPVGPVGKTRNASLDPERLLAGSATLE
jgi:cytoskeleton protein RodZ